MSEAISFEIGCRVKDENDFKGTVRYFGPIVGVKGNEMWLGIEWDDCSRGKHDGSHVDGNGISTRYFTCQNGGGSFIKPHKVFLGKKLDVALQERYVKVDAPTTVANDNVFFETPKGNKKCVEFVGEKWIRGKQQLESLTKVCVRNEDVGFIGETLQEIAPNLVEVDLQDNLLWQWNEIIKLGQVLPNLHSLLLQGNKMEPFNLSFANSCVFENLKVLALNGCNLTSWQDVEQLEKIVPGLEELYIANNNFGDLVSILSAEQFSQLRILDISFCNLTSSEQVFCFKKLSSLAELLLDGNHIDAFPSFEADDFQALERLSLSNTRFSSWTFFNQLHALPRLHNLRLANIPLFVGKGSSEVRPFIIGRVKGLTTLNGSSISGKEREAAERMYFKSILREFEGNQDTNNIHLLHPRYEELKIKLGQETMENQQKNITSSNLSSHLIVMKIHDLCGQENKCVTKSIPKTLTVGKLKYLIKQCFGTDPSMQVLSLRPFHGAIPVFLDDDEMMIEYFGAVDDSDIFVNYG